ncbi:phosphatase 2C [Coemansia sp. Benny D115]|nr:phosphatase 2C [Coemansia sp. Benny D115]
MASAAQNRPDTPPAAASPAVADMDTDADVARTLGSPDAVCLGPGADVPAGQTGAATTFPVASTIQPPPRLQRSSIPPPIDTENASRDADDSLHSKLLSSLSPASSAAASDGPLAVDAPAAVADADTQEPDANPAVAAPPAVPVLRVDADSYADDTACAHIGVSFSKNRRYRRTMEDAHFFQYDFAGRPGQALMAIFDGHAGRQAAQWCGENFAELFLQLRAELPDMPVPELLNAAFIETDRRLASDVRTHSGCTAVVAFIEVRDVPPSSATDATDSGTDAAARQQEQKQQKQRVLYCANAGDARAVLSRNGTAARLTYDHKGDDAHEIERISESGGYIFNGRVNGVLAVTRALGDSSLKRFVIGNPFTTETILTDDDDLLILACDGLWDVCSDQEAVDLIRGESDPTQASQVLLDYALANESMDNITTMVLRLPPL